MLPNQKSQSKGKLRREFKTLDEALQANLARNEEQHIAPKAGGPNAGAEPDLPADVAQKTYVVRIIPHDLLSPNPWNPRHYFKREELVTLADSLLEDGQLQNILARPDPNRTGYFQIVFGERRWRACGLEEAKYNNLKQLECRVGQFNDYDMARLAVVENTQRKDAAAIARARGFRSIYETSRAVGSPKSWAEIGRDNGFEGERAILRYVQMLELPEDVQKAMEEHELSEKHGRALLSLKSDESALRRLLGQIVREGLRANEAARRARDKKAQASGANTDPGVSVGRSSGSETGSAETLTPGSVSSGSRGTEPTRDGLFETSTNSAPSLADTVLGSLRAASVMVETAAEALEGHTPSAQLRQELLHELESIQVNVDRVRREIT